MKKFLVGLSMVLLSSVAFAVPTEQQVQDAVRSGNYTQAQSLMAEVVADKPNSAKAHYIYAEVLAHNGAFNKASDEAAKASELDPKITFTDPDKFRAFQQEVQRATTQAARPMRSAAPMTSSAPTYGTPSTGGGIPGWIWLVGLVILAIVLWRGLTRSRAAGGTMGPTGGTGYGAPGMNQGYGPGYGPYGPGGAPGVAPRSGALGTGLAVAGGVAGGMLLDEVLHRRDGTSGAGGGGLIPDAYADNGAASDLQNRSIDFGSGNDWDSGGGGGGGIDLGGGGDSGGGGGDWS